MRTIKVELSEDELFLLNGIVLRTDKDVYMNKYKPVLEDLEFKLRFWLDKTKHNLIQEVKA